MIIGTSNNTSFILLLTIYRLHIRLFLSYHKLFYLRNINTTLSVLCSCFQIIIYYLHNKLYYYIISYVNSY